MQKCNKNVIGMLHYGIITEVDVAGARARVLLEDLDELVTDFLPVLQRGTRADKTYWVPDVREHVVCLLDENLENGAILGSVYSSEDKPAETGAGLRFWQLAKGGAVVFRAAIDRAAGGVLSLWAKGRVGVETEADLTLAAGKEVEITGGSGVLLSAATGRVRLSKTGRLSVAANGGNLHKVLTDIMKYLTTHKHLVAGAATTVLSPDDLTKAAAIVLEIEKILED